MPVEDYIRNGQYELRAELPGANPERDIGITVAGEILTITAHRPEDTRAASIRSSATGLPGGASGSRRALT